MNTTVITVTFLRPPKTGLIYDSAALKKLKKNQNLLHTKEIREVRSYAFKEPSKNKKYSCKV